MDVGMSSLEMQYLNRATRDTPNPITLKNNGPNSGTNMLLFGHVDKACPFLGKPGQSPVLDLWSARAFVPFERIASINGAGQRFAATGD